MAERTVTIKECDRYQCRKRAGVASVTVVLTMGNDEPTTYVGDLCPYHQKQLFSKVGQMFKNTKPDERAAEMRPAGKE